jgi:predicted phosphohydrolase
VSVRLAWLTDLHLDFLSAQELEAFLLRVRNRGAGALLVGGDISHAARLRADLLRLREAAGKPVYFVLGNHDYYGSSIHWVHAEVLDLCETYPDLHWLSDSDVVELSPAAALIGDGGWGDMRFGDVDRAVALNDEYHIDELKVASRTLLMERLQQLAGWSASHIRRVLTDAVARYEEVILLTHVPPFREACWHEGMISDDEWLPRFTCAAVGDAVREIMADHPDRRLTVYCGHSHGEGYAEIDGNIFVWTGGAEYGAPKVQRVIEV